MATLRIDAHQHFWKYDPVKHAWINDGMWVIRRDYSPADLLPLLQAAGMDGCVAVQVNQAEEENTELLELAARHDFIKGVVGWVDLQHPAVGERLEWYRANPKIKGFRQYSAGGAGQGVDVEAGLQAGDRVAEKVRVYL